MACRLVAILLPILLMAAPVQGQQESPAAELPTDWHPQTEFDGKFDWLQMMSGEWLKGEILSMYDDELLFDSDEFDEQELNWSDVRQLRSARVVNLGLTGRRTATGILQMDGDRVLIAGDELQEFRKREVISITPGLPKEINYWSFKLFLGLTVRSGNTDTRDTTLQASIKRETVRNRIYIDVVGSENTTENEKVSENLRVSGAWDRFVRDRFFARPVFVEYFRDPFQNIGSRVTVGTGLGYDLIDNDKAEWTIVGGPAYQETRFSNVDEGDPESQSTPALVVGTRAEWDIADWIEFDGQYSFQIVNDISGRYNHHLLLSFETEITKWMDFDVSWIWDRIEKPRPLGDGTVPDKDDFRTTVGLTLDF